MKHKSQAASSESEKSELGPEPSQLAELTAQNQQLSDQLTKAQESERRALADYQNLVRRQQAEQRKLIKLAAQDFAQALIQPLTHLHLAAQQLKNQGLDMVIAQFWQALKDQGLAEIEALGKPFDPELMEVIEKQGEGDTVIKVTQPGYTLNGEVIQVAKVIVG